MVDPTWSRRRFLASAAGTAGIVVAGGTLAACGLQNGSSTDAEVGKSDSGWGGTLVSPPLAMPDVTFTTDKGEPYPLRESTKGKLTMLFFGYTNCPNQCPVYLNTVARARAAIGSGPGSVLTVLFVGIDLKRDTPTALRTYLNNIDAAFIGLTGTQVGLGRPAPGPVRRRAPQADGQDRWVHLNSPLASRGRSCTSSSRRTS